MSRPGTRTEYRARAHVRSPRAQRRAGSPGGRDGGGRAPARATSAGCPGPAAATADRYRDRRPGPPTPASARSSSSLPSAASPAVEPAPGTNLAGSTRPPDRPQRRRGRRGRPHPPVGRPRPRPAAASHPPRNHRSGSSTGHAGQDRSVRSGQHPQPAVFQPQALPGRTLLPARQAAKTPPRSVLPPARRGRMVQHFAQKGRGLGRAAHRPKEAMSQWRCTSYAGLSRTVGLCRGALIHRAPRSCNCSSPTFGPQTSEEEPSGPRAVLSLRALTRIAIWQLALRQ